MKWIFLLPLTTLTIGCATAQSDSAICDGTEKQRTAHAAALVADGGPQSKVTGAQLIALIDAGCGD